MNLRTSGLIISLLVIGCTTKPVEPPKPPPAPPPNVEPVVRTETVVQTKVIDTYCSQEGPIYLSKGDILTPPTAKIILDHNEYGEKKCGWKPITKKGAFPTKITPFQIPASSPLPSSGASPNSESGK